MLNVQTNVAMSRRIRNIAAYSICMLGTVSDRVTPGKHPGACTGPFVQDSFEFIGAIYK